jgi:hypothetical protein
MRYCKLRACVYVTSAAHILSRDLIALISSAYFAFFLYCNILTVTVRNSGRIILKWLFEKWEGGGGVGMD